MTLFIAFLHIYGAEIELSGRDARTSVLTRVYVCPSHVEATGDASVERQRSDGSRGIVETRVIIDEICNLDRVEEVDFALARLSICGFNVASNSIVISSNCESEDVGIKDDCIKKKIIQNWELLDLL